MHSFVYGWYVLYTVPRQEKKVEGQLKKNNISYYAPKLKSIRQWHDRKKVIEVPMFPCYIFVNVQSKKDFITAGCVKGVCSYIRIGTKPVVLSCQLLEQIRFVAEGKNCNGTKTSHFDTGQNLEIECGLFKGQIGQLVHSQDKELISIKIRMLNTEVVLNLPVA